MSRERCTVQGRRVLFSPEDSDLVGRGLTMAGAGYVYGRIPGNREKIGIHRVVLERMLGRPIREGMECDHINGDKLDNRRRNLREVTHRQNHQNRPPGRGCASRYKGVSPSAAPGRWRARISPHGKEIHLGSFGSEEEAALAYDRAAIDHYGEHAWLNRPLLEAAGYSDAGPVAVRP